MICGGPGVSDAYYCRECTLEVSTKCLSSCAYFPYSSFATANSRRRIGTAVQRL